MVLESSCSNTAEASLGGSHGSHRSGRGGCDQGPWSLSRITSGPSAFLPDRVILRGVGDGTTTSRAVAALWRDGDGDIRRVRGLGSLRQRTRCGSTIEPWDEAFAHLAIALSIDLGGGIDLKANRDAARCSKSPKPISSSALSIPRRAANSSPSASTRTIGRSELHDGGVAGEPGDDGGEGGHVGLEEVS